MDKHYARALFDEWQDDGSEIDTGQTEDGKQVRLDIDFDRFIQMKILEKIDKLERIRRNYG